MKRKHISPSLRRKITEQANNRCGYCRTSQEYSGVQFHIEHTVPLASGGKTEESNLWLACALCNGYKGAQTHGIDPGTGESIPLFHPKKQKWHEHFTWSENGVHIIGKTQCGRATVVALQLNNKFIVPARKHWVRVGWHPPDE